MECIDQANRAKKAGYSAKGGLLYDPAGKMINLPTADMIAREFGYMFVERMVKDLEEMQGRDGKCAE